MIGGKRVCVVMPAYNAAKTLEKTAAELDRDVVDDVIVVDDASHDDTVAIARRLGLHLVVHPRNRGYGGNQKTCYTEALAARRRHRGHGPPRLPVLAAGCSRPWPAMVASGHFDVVLGSRILGGRARGAAACRSGSTSRTASSPSARTCCSATSSPSTTPATAPSRRAPARAAAARGELRRLRLRQPDARAGPLVRLRHRRDHLPDPLLRRGLLHQLPAQRDVRLRRAGDRAPVPAWRAWGLTHPRSLSEEGRRLGALPAEPSTR